MSDHLIDPDSTLVAKHYAVVFTPRKQRSRFPENCVAIMDSAEEAVAASEPDQNRFPALVYGPSRSSEGFRLYYLVKWLDA